MYGSAEERRLIVERELAKIRARKRARRNRQLCALLGAFIVVGLLAVAVIALAVAPRGSASQAAGSMPTPYPTYTPAPTYTRLPAPTWTPVPPVAASTTLPSIPDAPTPLPTATSVPCPQQIAEYLLSIQGHIGTLAEAAEQAKAAMGMPTPLEGAGAAVAAMQKARNDIAQVLAPTCAQSAYLLFFTGLDRFVSGWQDPLGSRQCDVVEGIVQMNDGLWQLQALAQHEPTPAPREKPTCWPVAFPPAQPTATPTALQRNPTVVEGTSEAQFRRYLASKYATIAGQALEIEDVFIGNEDGPWPLRWVTIELTRHCALYVFAERTRAEAREYGLSLLRDVVQFFGGQNCSAYVSDNFTTFNLLDHYFDEDWYYIGDYDVKDGWYISKDYVQARYKDGIEDIEVWNYK